MDRHQMMMELLRREQLDAVLVSDRYNVRYLSRFTGDTAYLYISQKRCVLMTDSRYTTWARSEAQGFEIFQVSREMPYEKKLVELMEEENIQSIGFENRKMIYSDVIKLQNQSETLSGLVWKALDDRLDAIRRIKTEEELELIAKAEAIGDRAFSHIIRMLNTGMTEQEVAWELEASMRREGAEGLSFDTIAVFGERTAMPHAVPGKRRLQKGDFVVMDFGCIYEGYCSDMTRTVVMGQADAQQRKIYNVVLEAQQRALQYIRSQVTACEVDRVARDVIEEAGYGAYFGHGLGHSVGLYIHESPALSPGDATVLQENMLETVEPGIYVPDFGGVRIEDLVVVKNGGCRNLTGSKKDLLEL